MQRCTETNHKRLTMITITPLLCMRTDGYSGQANLFDIQCSERNIVKSYIIPRTHRKHSRNALEQTFGHDPKHAFTNDSENESTHDSRDTLTNDSKHMFGNESKIMLRRTPE